MEKECNKKESVTLDDLRMELWLRKRNAGILTWTTKDGHEIALKDLSDEHLANIIGLLIRKMDIAEILKEMVGGIDN